MRMAEVCEGISITEESPKCCGTKRQIDENMLKPLLLEVKEIDENTQPLPKQDRIKLWPPVAAKRLY